MTRARAWDVIGAHLHAAQVALAPSRDGGWLLIDAGDTIVARAATIPGLAVWIVDYYLQDEATAVADEEAR